MLMTVLSSLRATTTCDALLKSFVSALPTKKPQKADALGGASSESRASSASGFIFGFSFRNPFVVGSGEEVVEERHRGRGEEQGPQESVRAEQFVLPDERDRGDQGGVWDARGAVVRDRLRVRDHEEREEQQRAALELVEQHREALAEPEDAEGNRAEVEAN